MKKDGNRYYWWKKKEEKQIKEMDKKPSIQRKDERLIMVEINQIGRCWRFS